MTANSGPSSSSCCRLDSSGSLGTPHRLLRLSTQLHPNVYSLVKLRILYSEKRPFSGRCSRVINDWKLKCASTLIGQQPTHCTHVHVAYRGWLSPIFYGLPIYSTTLAKEMIACGAYKSQLGHQAFSHVFCFSLLSPTRSKLSI
jgi:hypothetical protein